MIRNTILIISSLLAPWAVSAQPAVGFENFNLPPNTFLNNAGPSGAFSSPPLSLPNNYNSQWMSWSGWAISNRTDTLTPGFTNESSAIAGGGQGGSATYAISYVPGSSTLRLDAPRVVSGLYVTNNAYAYYSMKDGDAFAKKFGGITGNDPDFFRLTVKKYLGGQLGPDSVNFFLADYRFADNSQDYIVKPWTFVSLVSLGAADSLQFTLASSDVGAFGMNTPAYFCIDQVILNDVLSDENAPAAEARLLVYPNPATDFIYVECPDEEGAVVPVAIYDQAGRQVLTGTAARIDVRGLPSGRYWVVARGERRYVSLFLKW